MINLGPAPSYVDAAQKYPLGTEGVDTDQNVYVYLKGVTSCADGSWVSYVPGTWTAVLLAASAKGSVAIATAAVDAATEYGWFLIQGSDTAVCESSILSNAQCYATSTAGEVDDTVVVADQIHGAKTTTAGVAGATATVAVNRPYIGVADAII